MIQLGQSHGRRSPPLPQWLTVQTPRASHNNNFWQDQEDHWSEIGSHPEAPQMPPDNLRSVEDNDNGWLGHNLAAHQSQSINTTTNIRSIVPGLARFQQTTPPRQQQQEPHHPSVSTGMAGLAGFRNHAPLAKQGLDMTKIDHQAQYSREVPGSVAPGIAPFFQQRDGCFAWPPSSVPVVPGLARFQPRDTNIPPSNGATDTLQIPHPIPVETDPRGPNDTDRQNPPVTFARHSNNNNDDERQGPSIFGVPPHEAPTHDTAPNFLSDNRTNDVIQVPMEPQQHPETTGLVCFQNGPSETNHAPSPPLEEATLTSPHNNTTTTTQQPTGMPTQQSQSTAQPTSLQNNNTGEAQPNTGNETAVVRYTFYKGGPATTTTTTSVDTNTRKSPHQQGHTAATVTVNSMQSPTTEVAAATTAASDHESQLVDTYRTDDSLSHPLPPVARHPDFQTNLSGIRFFIGDVEVDMEGNPLNPADQKKLAAEKLAVDSPVLQDGSSQNVASSPSTKSTSSSSSSSSESSQSGTEEQADNWSVSSANSASVHSGSHVPETENQNISKLTERTVSKPSTAVQSSCLPSPVTFLPPEKDELHESVDGESFHASDMEYASELFQEVYRRANAKNPSSPSKAGQSDTAVDTESDSDDSSSMERMLMDKKSLWG